MSYGCGCGNPWNSIGGTQGVCGTFEEPAVEDKGRCSPYRQKIDCEAPVPPVAQCDDDTYVVIPQPGNTVYPFVISAKMFDECCEVFTDENGDPITLILTEMSDNPPGICAT